MCNSINDTLDQLEDLDPQLRAAAERMLRGTLKAAKIRHGAGDPQQVSALDWARLDPHTAATLACSLLELMRFSVRESRASKSWKDAWLVMASDLDGLITAMSAREES